jgi:hypothetical protein
VSERLPRPDSSRIRDTVVTDDDLLVLNAGVQLLRIHPLGGAHPHAWDQFRSWGPTRSRFDHHTLPRRNHPVRRIAYLTRGDTAFTAALAEYFQDDAGGVGPIDRGHRRPTATIITLVAEVTLNLDGGWVKRAVETRRYGWGPEACPATGHNSSGSRLCHRPRSLDIGQPAPPARVSFLVQRPTPARFCMNETILLQREEFTSDVPLVPS